MVFSFDYFDKTLHIKPKEMKIILQECDLWNLELKAFCNKSNILLENPKCYIYYIY